jgi:predicted Abi (CAAX) family protease
MKQPVGNRPTSKLPWLLMAGAAILMLLAGLVTLPTWSGWVFIGAAVVLLIASGVGYRAEQLRR